MLPGPSVSPAAPEAPGDPAHTEADRLWPMPGAQSPATLPDWFTRALADAITTLLADPGQRQRLGEAGHRRVRQEYDVTRNVVALAKLLRQTQQPPPVRQASAE